jgi:hypothetical protein
MKKQQSAKRRGEIIRQCFRDFAHGAMLETPKTKSRTMSLSFRALPALTEHPLNAHR